MIKETFFNDLSLLSFYGITLLAAFVTLLAAILWHELGHFLYFKFKLKKRIKVKFELINMWNMKWKAGELEDYQSLTDKQYHDVNMCGILCGYIPILILGIMYPLMLYITIPYTTGCWGDIKRMMESAKKLPPLPEE